jgi:methylase of polypeptide subunit release factors
MLHFPELVRGKRLFEPFAGSGPLGFMALKVGAQHVDFLDINPRASAFLIENARLNQLAASRFRSIEADIATFEPERRYDLILANPPFVPTPEGIEGTIASNGGPEGNRFVEILLRRLEEFLEPDGEALILVFQFVKSRQPLLIDLISRLVVPRSVELTSSQERPISLEAYSEAYTRLFQKARDEIARWRSALLEKHGEDLTLCHYVVRVRARGDAPASCVMRDDFVAEFGESFLVPSEDEKEISLGRVFENFVPSRDRHDA